MDTLSSNKVKAFPAVGRIETYADSAYLSTETNLTNILRSIYPDNNCSFVISNTFTVPLKFILNGYYFEISDLSSLSATNLWARIYIKDTDVKQKLTNPDATKTDLDVDDKFNGLFFYTSESKSGDIVDGCTAYDLQLTDASGNIVAKSKLHYETTRLQNADGTKLDETFSTNSINSTSLSTISASIDTLSVKNATLTGSLTLSKSIGSAVNPIYVDSTGHIVNTTSTIGSSSKPVYLNSGTIDAISTISLSGKNYLEQLESSSITTSYLTVTTSANINTLSGVTASFSTINGGSVSGTNGNFTNVTVSQKLTAGSLIASAITTSSINITSEVTFPASLGSASKPIFIDSNKKLAATTDTIGNSSKPIYMNNGELTALNNTIGSASKPVYVDSGTITAISNLSLSGSSTLGTLTNTTVDSSCNLYAGNTADYAVYTTTGGKLTAASLSTADPTASAQNLSMTNNTCSFSYIDTNSQDSKGKISTSKKYITITYATSSDRSYLEIK